MIKMTFAQTQALGDVLVDGRHYILVNPKTQIPEVGIWIDEIREFLCPIHEEYNNVCNNTIVICPESLL